MVKCVALFNNQFIYCRSLLCFRNYARFMPLLLRGPDAATAIAANCSARLATSVLPMTEMVEGCTEGVNAFRWRRSDSNVERKPSTAVDCSLGEKGRWRCISSLTVAQTDTALSHSARLLLSRDSHKWPLFIRRQGVVTRAITEHTRRLFAHPRSELLKYRFRLPLWPIDDLTTSRASAKRSRVLRTLTHAFK